MGRYYDNIKQGNIDAGQTADITALKGLLTQGANAPSTKPTAKNLLYFATSTKILYVSTDTANASDWKPVVGYTTG